MELSQPSRPRSNPFCSEGTLTALKHPYARISNSNPTSVPNPARRQAVPPASNICQSPPSLPVTITRIYLTYVFVELAILKFSPVTSHSTAQVSCKLFHLKSEKYGPGVGHDLKILSVGACVLVVVDVSVSLVSVEEVRTLCLLEQPGMERHFSGLY
ncbi:hypothetical protein BDV98DRAFT_310121 [Pterulicium gracile]|uniref:Uncharacterized protein n=1 Tax=Pterulicium gracile TaxID=1884261 RepID=A0A5C3Q3M4_9AGAR|nr:hypothetical protein BDV98DRAFT_310121 [Pterula gracilis]